MRIESEGASAAQQETHHFQKAIKALMDDRQATRNSPRRTAGQVAEREVQTLELVLVVEYSSHEHITTHLLRVIEREMHSDKLKDGQQQGLFVCSSVQQSNERDSSTKEQAPHTHLHHLATDFSDLARTWIDGQLLGDGLVVAVQVHTHMPHVSAVGQQGHVFDLCVRKQTECMQ